MRIFDETEKGILRSNGFSEIEILKVEELLLPYENYFSSFSDLTGDELVPSKMFLFNLKHLIKMLDNDPEIVISKKAVLIRQKVLKPIIDLVGPLFLRADLNIENRNELKGIIDPKTGTYKKDNGIIIPDEPVIWTPNHRFKDDALGSVLAIKRSAYILFGSLPQYFNTIDGILAYLIGALLINRKVKESRIASTNKAIYANSLGADLIIYPEGVWNKTPNKLFIDFWPGFYNIAKETGAKCIPVIHYIYDPTESENKHTNKIRTVIDDPIDFNEMHGMSEQACINYYREVMSTWYYLMMNKYGPSAREKVLNGFETSIEAWEDHLNKHVKSTERYDSEIETTAYYKRKDITTLEEVYESLANAPLTKENAREVLAAREIVKLERRNNFQARY